MSSMRRVIMMTTLRNLIGVVLAMFIVFNCAAQQITGSIRGTVVDSTGATVQGASVSATQTETGLSRTSIIDRSGAYVLLELPVGHYRLQVEGKGFATYVQQGIVLDVNETATIPVRLAVGAETQHIEVQADAVSVGLVVRSGVRVQIGPRERGGGALGRQLAKSRRVLLAV